MSLASDNSVCSIIKGLDPDGNLTNILGAMSSIESWIIDPAAKLPSDVSPLVAQLDGLVKDGVVASSSHLEPLITLLASLSTMRMVALVGLIKTQNPDFLTEILTLATDLVQSSDKPQPYAQIIIDRVRVLLNDELAGKIFDIKHVEAIFQ